MILTAQRVRAPSGAEGVNSFHYQHNDSLLALHWADEPAALIDAPVTLTGLKLGVPTEGNRVQSYVDLVVPPDVRLDEVTDTLRAIVALPDCPRGVVNVPGTRCAVGVWVQPMLLPAWRREFLGLAQHALVDPVPVVPAPPAR